MAPSKKELSGSAPLRSIANAVASQMLSWKAYTERGEGEEPL